MSKAYQQLQRNPGVSYSNIFIRLKRMSFWRIMTCAPSSLSPTAKHEVKTSHFSNEKKEVKVRTISRKSNCNSLFLYEISDSTVIILKGSTLSIVIATVMYFQQSKLCYIKNSTKSKQHFNARTCSTLEIIENLGWQILPHLPCVQIRCLLLFSSFLHPKGLHMDEEVNKMYGTDLEFKIKPIFLPPSY